MLSIATLRSVDYYTDAVEESFRYYGSDTIPESDPPGTWTGELAKRYFGTGSVVEKPAFAALFFGFDPETGKPLVKNADQLGYAEWQAKLAIESPTLNAADRKQAARHLDALRSQLRERDASIQRKHRPGIDLTFSAPKDFSLLVAAASPQERTELLAAFQRSVETTLKTAETRYVMTRLRDEGKLRKERVAGSAIALFSHITARSVGNADAVPDPDVHCHGIVFNPQLCFDEATRTLFSNDLRLNLKVLDAEARARLAQELRHMGYMPTEDRQKNCTSFHLPGITAEERARYSKRRGEILAGLAGGDFTSSAVAAIGTRQGKGDWTRSKALAAWQDEFAGIGLTAERLREAQPETMPHARNDKEIIEALLDMKSFFSARELRAALWSEAQFADVHPGVDIGNWIDARANQLLKSPDLLVAQLPDGSTASRQRTAAEDDEPVFTTRSLLKRELQLDETVNVLGRQARHCIDWDEAARSVAAIEQRKTAEAMREAEERGTPLPKDFRWMYRDDQKAAIAKILAGADISFFQASAGTGKTQAAAAIIETYRSHGMKVIALAPSNKAAGQLSADCGLDGSDKAMTVDAFLLSKAKDTVNADTVIFVDESSMLGFDNAEKLVNLAQQRGAKLICQGDSRQLPSVQRGRVFANWIERRLGTDSAELTVITRQREDWAKRATEAAARGDFAATLAMLDEHGQIHTEGTAEAVLDRLARDYLADTQPANQKLIVASRNADVATLNRRIRAELVRTGQVAEGMPCLAGKDNLQVIRVGEGDRLIFTGTLKEGRQKIAANGTIGTVESVAPSSKGLRVRVRLDGERKVVEFDSADFNNFSHAFSISIHKSQGASVESARFLFSEFSSSELCYVAMSRHRSSFGLYCLESQKLDLPRWMTKHIEKFDARDLVSLDELNAAAQSLRAADERNAGSLRDYLRERFPVVIKRALKPVINHLPSITSFSLPAVASRCVERFQRHRQRLTTYLKDISISPVRPPIADLTAKLVQRRASAIPVQHHGKEAPRP